MSERATAQPGVISDMTVEHARAVEASTASRAALRAEEDRLAALPVADAVSRAQQAARVDAARRDLDAAEAFEQSLEDGQI